MKKEQAIELYNSKFWETMNYYDIAKFQLFEKKLCMPFNIFHEAIEKMLKRSVSTHEFGLNHDSIVKEFLGEKSAPTFEDILDLIPEEKRIIIIEKKANND